MARVLWGEGATSLKVQEGMGLSAETREDFPEVFCPDPVMTGRHPNDPQVDSGRLWSCELSGALRGHKAAVSRFLNS